MGKFNANYTAHDAANAQSTRMDAKMTYETHILFIPGLLCDARLFAPQIAALQQTHSCVVAAQDDGDDIAEAAAAILRAAPPRFALVGLSMGGYLAMEIMRRAPERVRRLCLMDTTAAPDTAEAVARRERLIALARSGRFGQIPALMAPSFLAPAHIGDPAVTGVIEAMAAAVGPERFIRQQRIIIGRPDSRPSLARIAVPTTVVVGEHDALTPPDRAAEIAAAIAGARRVVIPGAGHLPPIETPEATTAALKAWVNGAPKEDNLT